MYAMSIATAESYRHARLARLVLEGGGFVGVALNVKDEAGEHNALLGSAPAGGVEQALLVAGLYISLLGPRAEEEAIKTTQRIADQGLQSKNAIPLNQRDAVRNQLLAAVFTIADETGVTVVETDPNRSTLNRGHDLGDEHTDAYDSWKPGRDIEPPQPVDVTTNPRGGGYEDCDGELSF